MINPKNKLFRWGPIEGRPIYPDYWYGGFNAFNKKYKPGWPAVISYFNKEKFLVVVDAVNLYKNGEEIFKKYILADNEFSKNLKRWQKLIFDFKLFYKKIALYDLRKLNGQELSELFLKWNDFYAREFWHVGSLPEMANWGGEKMLAAELKKRIKNEQDFNYCFERLAAPEDYSFYQKEELGLLALKRIKDKKLLDKKLWAHQEKYFWLLNSYYETKVLPVAYFKKIIDSYSAEAALSKINEIKSLKKRAVLDKKEVVKKFKLLPDILKIGQRLAYCVWWQDLRKSYIFQANYAIDILFKEISMRFKIDFIDLHYYAIKELEEIFQGKKLPDAEVKRRRQYFLALYEPQKGISYFSGSAAKKLFSPYASAKIKKGIEEFKGLVVNRGIARGKARIICSPKEAGKLKKGEILVAAMTSPDYILALKRASAVITDEGGMTCHAAIVSRELAIPCIVGTKIATKVLKDGDLVEVDAINGTVRIIKVI